MRLTPLIILMACDPKTPQLDEGEENPFVRDPWGNDDNPQEDTANQEDSDLETVEPNPSDVSVCYFGANRDHEECIETVDHDPSWGGSYTYPEPYQGSAQYAAPVRYVDLQSVEPDTLLAPNFKLYELMSLEKGRFALFSPLVVETLQYVRDDLGGPLIVSSAYRNVSYNANVGGVTHSRHQYGDAVDLQTDVVDLEALAELCDLYAASFISVYESHVHCDWRDDPLEPAFYSETFSNGHFAEPELYWTSSGWTTSVGDFVEGHPQRSWTARSVNGGILDKQKARFYVPPENTRQIEVVVGGRSVLHARW